MFASGGLAAHLDSYSTEGAICCVNAQWIMFYVHAIYNIFAVLARDSIYAITRYMLSPVRPSVRPSVRLPVSLTHGWISQKRLKLGWCNFHHRVAP